MRRLSLVKETLSELTTAELTDVVGAASYRTKYDCTVSVDVCNPLSEQVCLEMDRSLLCPTTV